MSSWIAAMSTRRSAVWLSWWPPLAMTTTRSRHPREWSQLPIASSLVPLAYTRAVSMAVPPRSRNSSSTSSTKPCFSVDRSMLPITSRETWVSTWCREPYLIVSPMSPLAGAPRPSSRGRPVPFERVVPPRVTVDATTGGNAHAGQQLPVPQQQTEVVGEGRDVAWGDEEALPPVLHELAGASGRACDHGEPEPHRLEVGDGQALVRRRHRQHVAPGQVGGNVGVRHGSNQVHARPEAGALDQPAHVPDVGGSHRQAARHGQSPGAHGQASQRLDQHMEALAGDHVGDADDTERARLARPLHHLGVGDPGRQVVARGMDDDAGHAPPDKSLGGGSRRLAAEDRGVDTRQVAAFDRGVEGSQRRPAELVDPQDVDNGDDRAGAPLPEPAVRPDERRVVQLVLQEDVEARSLQPAGECPRHVVAQVAAVVPPRQRDDLDVVPAGREVLRQLAVVEVAAGERLQAPVDHQADPHHAP